MKLKLQRAKRKPQMEEKDEKELLGKYKKKSNEEKQERGKVGKRKLTWNRFSWQFIYLSSNASTKC